jgi:hypothetical protein
LTVPLNPLTAVNVIVDVPVWPTITGTLVGLAVTVKSVTLKSTLAEWDWEPLVPVTVAL